tara:strand:- start:228 stop:386 length:159 start_codon:yes stop_codon:yes gene_type:complete
MIEVLQHILGFLFLVGAGWVAWESSVMVSEKKARYKAGTHDYYDRPIEKDDE